MNSKSSIGIFDSGLGGLTVYKEVKNHFPNEQFIYLGDLAYLPYGSKSSSTIIERSKKIVEFLIHKNIKGIIVACNSASSVALQTLRNSYDIPIIGMINPSVLLAYNTTKTKSIGLIGTQTTIRSKSYEKALYLIASSDQFSITSIACPLFVSLVEDGWMFKNKKVIYEIALDYFTHLIKKSITEEKTNQIDTIILGCTHYPIIFTEIKKAFDNLGYKDLAYIDNANAIIPSIQKYFNLASVFEDNNSQNKKGLLDKKSNIHPSTDMIYITGNQSDYFRELAKNMLKHSSVFSHFSVPFPEKVSL